MKRRLAVKLSLLILFVVLLRAGEARGQSLKERLARRAALDATKNGNQFSRARRRSPAPRRARGVKSLVLSAAARYRVDPRLLWSVVYLEKRIRRASPASRNQTPPFAVSTRGVTNVRPTARRVETIARRLRQLTLAYDRRPDLVLASYHAGESAVDAYLYGRVVRLADDRVINERQLKTDGVPPYRRTQNYVARGLKIYDRLGKRIFPLSDPPAERSVCEIPPLQPAEKGPVLEILPATARLTRPRFVSPPPKPEIFEEDLFYDSHSGARFVIGTGGEDRPAESVDPPPDFDSAPLPSDDIAPQSSIHAVTRVRTIYGGAFANGAGGHSF